MKTKNNESLIIKYFIVFLLLFIVPIVLICVITNTHSNSVFKKITTEGMQRSLNSLLKVAENAFYDAEKIAVQLAYDEKLEKATNIQTRKTIKENEIYTLYEAFDVLENMAESNKNIDSIIVYNRDSGQVISSDRSVENVSFYVRSQWYNAYQHNNDTLVWLKDTVETFEYSTIKRKDVISAMYPMGKGSVFNGAIIVNIPIELLGQLAYDSSELFIVPPDGGEIISLKKSKNISLSDDDKDELKDVIKTGSKRDGAIFTKLGEERYIASYVTSGYNNLCFVMVSSESDIFKYMENFTRFVIVIGILALLLGFVMAYFLSKKFYSPIKKIVNDIKHRISDSPDGKNEWNYIEGALEKLMQQDKETQKIKEKARTDERTMLIKKIISDGIENWEDYHEIFIYQNYCVVIVEIDEFKKFVTKYSSTEREYMISLGLDVTKNIINSQGKFIADGFTGENSFTVLMNTEIRSLTEFSALFSLVNAEVKKIMDTDVTVAVGRTVEAGSVSMSYAEAKSAFEDRFFTGNGSVIFYKSKKENFKDVKPEEDVLVNNLKLVNREQVFKYIDNIIRSLTETENAEYARQQMILIVVMLLNCANEYGIPLFIINGGKSALGEFMKCRTINAAQNLICCICEQIMNHFEIMLDKNNYKNRIMEYVHSNYCTDIDVYCMAHDLGISYSQLRRLFMECTGENIVVYTNRLRIEQAKRMLTETDKTIVEIANETGYNNDQSFNRNFKKFEGITPGEYRKKYLNH